MAGARGGYHEGERRAQRRAGIEAKMARAGAPGPSIPVPAAAFLRERRWIVVALADDVGAPRIAPLTGPPGFVSAIGDAGIAVSAPPPPALRVGASIGLLAIEPATKRRMKAKGEVTSLGPTGFMLATRSVYALCPRFITPRQVELRSKDSVRTGSGLGDEERELIERADTFFLATHSPAGGADASHRGGPPGFVRTRDAHTIEFADYTGNNMFNTVGNLELDARIALLFIDFASGGTLAIAGRAHVDWLDAGDRTIRVAVERLEAR